MINTVILVSLFLFMIKVYDSLYRRSIEVSLNDNQKEQIIILFLYITIVEFILV